MQRRRDFRGSLRRAARFTSEEYVPLVTYRGSQQEPILETQTNPVFYHSVLHVYYVSGPQIHPFSEIILTSLLHSFDPSWGFNHVRLTNLADPPALPRERPAMDQATSILLIINNMSDLHQRHIGVFRKAFTSTKNLPVLVLINVPQRHRCVPNVFHRRSRRVLERTHEKSFRRLFRPEKSTILRVLACPARTAARIVHKAVKWLTAHNLPVVGVPEQMATAAREKVSSFIVPGFVPVRPKEYEDIQSLNMKPPPKPARASKSLSATELKAAEAKTPYFKPDEPRYDAEYGAFRTRRNVRRFVRRLRAAVRENREEDSGPVPANSDESVDEDSYYADDEDEDENEDESSGGYEVVNGQISTTSELAAEMEPILFRREVLAVMAAMANRAEHEQEPASRPSEQPDSLLARLLQFRRHDEA